MDFKTRELLETGGSWLGRARAWIQTHKRNGSTVTWGSQEALNPPVTVGELEEVAATAAAEAYADAGKNGALDRIKALEAEVEHWRTARQRAILGGEILKRDLEAALAQIHDYRKALDFILTDAEGPDAMYDTAEAVMAKYPDVDKKPEGV